MIPPYFKDKVKSSDKNKIRDLVKNWDLIKIFDDEFLKNSVS